MYRGEPIKRNGTRYRHRIHESLVFTANSFYWNARSEKGNSIDFLMLYYGMDFISAVNELLSYINISAEPYKTPQPREEFRFSDIRLDISTDFVMHYLSDMRCIDRKLIADFIARGYIYQEYATNNIIFPMYDEKHKAVGAEIHGSTKDSRYKGIAKNSKYGYGFNLVYGKPETVYFFESAIDLLSYLELMMKEQKQLSEKCFVSMGGLKENIVKHMTELYSSRIVLCADNDSAGHVFTNKILQTYSDTDVLYPPKEKDWNAYLMNIKRLENTN
ncbi:MAG: DUF3991 and TOPRIM domain-containing protein [Clostridia bacterium]|nr:DUF3991 and TOPRIM domain-containing protein [Clostridia bacterium]